MNDWQIGLKGQIAHRWTPSTEHPEWAWRLCKSGGPEYRRALTPAPELPKCKACLRAEKER